jgi:hypothetical protein
MESIPLSPGTPDPGTEKRWEIGNESDETVEGDSQAAHMIISLWSRTMIRAKTMRIENEHYKIEAAID